VAVYVVILNIIKIVASFVIEKFNMFSYQERWRDWPNETRQPEKSIGFFHGAKSNRNFLRDESPIHKGLSQRERPFLVH
jgi:hypothetical protein